MLSAPAISNIDAWGRFRLRAARVLPLLLFICFAAPPPPAAAQTAQDVPGMQAGDDDASFAGSSSDLRAFRPRGFWSIEIGYGNVEDSRFFLPVGLFVGADLPLYRGSPYVAVLLAPKFGTTGFIENFAGGVQLKLLGSGGLYAAGGLCYQAFASLPDNSGSSLSGRWKSVYLDHVFSHNIYWSAALGFRAASSSYQLEFRVPVRGEVHVLNEEEPNSPNLPSYMVWEQTAKYWNLSLVMHLLFREARR